MGQLINKLVLDENKKLGRYYTPLELSNILCNWAIRSTLDSIFEPSFGGCSFLESACSTLRRLGSKKPISKISGCDIDNIAFHHLSNRVGLVNISKRFVHGDFLGTLPSDFKNSKFDVIIGNPPYVSYHNMSAQQREQARQSVSAGEFKLSKQASLWAYFILHSLLFLNRSGRMALVLPSSFLTAKYSIDIHETLTNNFNRILAIPLNERLFQLDKVDERTVILLADGFGTGPSGQGIEFKHAASVSDISRTIASWEMKQLNTQPLEVSNRASLLPSDVIDIYKFISIAEHTVKLGAIAKIKIGVVTGDNSYFVINDDKAILYKLPPYALKPILSKMNYAEGVVFHSDDYHVIRAMNRNCLLVDTTKLRQGSNPLQRYLQSYPAAKLASNKTFRKRSIWHRPDNGLAPDAFMSYMHHYGPKLVLNDAGVTCTNSIHRVYFDKNLTQAERKLASISILSSFSQLSAEIEGRSYGSGILKNEPGEAKEICIIMPSDVSSNQINKCFAEIDALLRIKSFDKARHKADELVLKRYGHQTIDKLAATLELLRARRSRQGEK